MTMQTSDLLLRRAEMPDPAIMKRIPQRPAGAISHFVAEELHNVLALDAAASAKELQHADALAANSDAATKICSPEEAALAQLDCAMLECAIVSRKGSPSEQLRSLSDRFAAQADAHPGLTYQGIIAVNPLKTDPRLFSRGDAAKAELFFYTVHNVIERHLAEANVRLQMLLSDGDSFPETLDTASAAVASLQKGFRSLLFDLPREYFMQFRGYFHNRHRRIPGPSALFSAGMYCLDTYICANDKDMRGFLESEKDPLIRFYPSTDAGRHNFTGRYNMRDARTLAAAGGVIGRSDRQSHPDFQNLCADMVHARSMHLGIAKKFLPEGFKAVGTGQTTDIRTLLEKPLNVYRGLSGFAHSSPKHHE